MKKWYKFWKKATVNNYLVAEEYFEYHDDYSHEDIRYICEEWADEVSFNNSFSYGFEEVNLPPMNWITNKIKSNNTSLNYLKEHNKKLNDILKIYLRKDKILKINKLWKELNK